ncbi:MAG: hypothetical protein JWN25_215 [Verrucomicrobiales bacterium]|nr:hypothetical protein [Verrucomicrobiales bacterium]
MKSFVPRTGSVTEWNKAYFRLEDFLRAHQVNDKVHQSQLILRMMRIAAERHSKDPSQSPTTLVMQEAFTEMDVWFKQLLPTNNIPPERLAALGRVGMHMMNATHKWPNVFLSGEDLPSEFTHQIYQTTVKAGPDLRISSMIPRPLDTNPEGEVLDEKWERLGKVPLTLVVGASLLFSLGVVLYVFH